MSEITDLNPTVPSQVVAKVSFPKWVNQLGIIPTTYKNAMGYYETLAWLCKYLEETVIPTVNQNGEAVEELQGLYVELKNYVDNYFDNLDVQEEINNKLDEMVTSGQLQQIVDTYFSYITERINSFESNINDEMDLMDARIDSIASLPEGSTSGDAEVIDARIGANGATYANLGTAIRTQIGKLNNENIFINGIINVANDLTSFNIPSNLTIFDYKGGYRFIIAGDFEIASNNTYVLSTSNESIVNPDLSAKGTGQTLYLKKLNSYTQLAYDNVIFAIKFNGVFISSLNNVIMNNYYLTYSKFNYRITSELDKITLNEDMTLLTVENDIALFDNKGGYRFIKPCSVSLDNLSHSLIVLSTSEDSIINPNLSIKGTGESLYLHSISYNTVNPTRVIFGQKFGKCISSVDNYVMNCYYYNKFNSIINYEKIGKGLLPSEPFTKGNLINDYEIFEKIKNKNSDVTIVHLGDSISTDIYTSSLPDPEYTAPRMDSKYIPSYIFNLYKWLGQEYRRADAKIEKSSETDFFIEYGNGTDKYYDEAWDEQLTPITNNYYNLFTRVLTDNQSFNAGIKFTIPAGTKTFSLIYRTDYLCADTTKVTINEGDDNICECKIIGESNFTEANDYEFTMKETNEILEDTITLYNNTTKVIERRVSKSQMRLIFNVLNSANDIDVTIQNEGAGRFNYWGVEYSKNQYMFRYINYSRGGHNIAGLKLYDSYEIDLIKPDMIIVQNPIINEGAMSVVGITSQNTTTAFKNRFSDYYTYLKSKTYSPEILAYTLFIGSQAQIVNELTGKYNVSNTNYESNVDVFKYINSIDSINITGIKILDYFYDYFNIAEKLAKNTNNIYVSAIKGSTKTGNTLTTDNVHLNDYGNLIGYNLLKSDINI